MRRWPLKPLPAIALLTLLTGLSGCDGGISGTGVPPVDASGTGTPNGTGEAIEDAEAEPTSNAPADADSTRPPGTQPRQLANAVAVREQGLEIRLVNARTVAVALDSGPDGVRLIEQVAALGTAPATAVLVDDGRSIAGGAVARLGEPLRILSLDDGEPLAVFEPLALVDGSVTTLVVGSADSQADPVIVLTTRLEPPDPSLSMLRVVSTVALEANAQGAVSPSLSGGAADLELDPIGAARPATDYVVLTPGDYTLRLSSDAQVAYPLSLAAGEVVTAYLLAPAQPGGAPRLQPLLDSGPQR